VVGAHARDGASVVRVGGVAGERLGWRLAVASDGSKRLVLAGAPGLDASSGSDPSAGAVYAIDGAHAPGMVAASTLPKLAGTTGQHLGTALAARGTLLAAGAPGANTVQL